MKIDLRIRRFSTLLGISLTAGILLWLGWLSFPFSFLLFFAIVPILYLDRKLEQEREPIWIFFILVYLCMFFWNTMTCYWICKTTVVGGVAVFIFNSLVLTIPFLLFHIVRRKSGDIQGYSFLAMSWIAMEYLHNSWPLAFPMLTLGNGLARFPEAIQFYEYSGVLGGSLWILLSNIYFFIAGKNFFEQTKQDDHKKFYFLVAVGATLLSVPLVASVAIYHSYKEKGTPVEVVVIHPNLNNRSQKYTMDQDSLLKHQLKLTANYLTSNTDYVLWPETAIPNGGWIEELNKNQFIYTLLTYFSDYPKAKLVTGVVLYELYNNGKVDRDVENVPDIRYSPDSKVWYYTYNASIQLGTSEKSIQVRSKEKLVPVEETIPFAKQFGLVRKIIPSLGGYLFAVRSASSTVFKSDTSPDVSVSSLICYESAFGGLTAKMVLKGANILFIGLNEGWYRSHDGASQFLYAAVVRAIENRRSIARSSNDGISCFINQRGDVSQKISDYSPTSIREVIRANKDLSFYSTFNGLLGIFSILSTIVISIAAVLSNNKVEKPH